MEKSVGGGLIKNCNIPARWHLVVSRAAALGESANCIRKAADEEDLMAIGRKMVEGSLSYLLGMRWGGN